MNRRNGAIGMACALVLAALVAGPGPGAVREADAAVGAGRFVTLAPLRLFDTRPGAAPTGDGIDGLVAPGGSVSVDVAGRLGVAPAAVTAVVLNVTITEATGVGFVQVVPSGAALGGSSNLNVEAVGQTIANQVTVPVGADGRVVVFTQGGGHLLADVLGWFTPAASSRAGRYVPLPAPTPRRILDTRAGAPLAAGGTVRVPIAAPGTASAVVVGLTVTEATAPGFWQVVPTAGATAFGASSNLNVTRAGQTIANQAIVPLGADGSITVFSQSGGHLVVDEAGVITAPGADDSTAGLFVPITPARLLDTRDPTRTPVPGPLGALSAVTVTAAGRSGIDASATAVALNVTATEAAADGYVQAMAAGQSPGATSTVNVERPGQTIAGAAWTALADGSFTVFTQRGGHLLADAAGWFTAGGPVTGPATSAPATSAPATTGPTTGSTTTTVPARPTYAYLGTSDTAVGAGVATYRVDPTTGALAFLGRTATHQPAFLALHPTLDVLYAVDETTPGFVGAFSIDPGTGLLTSLGRVSVGNGPTHLVVDPTGRWLVVANYVGGTWNVVALQPDGRLGAVTDTVARACPCGPSNRQLQPHPHGSAFDPSGRWLATADLGTDTVEVFRLVNGQLQSVDTAAIAAGSGPRHVAFGPDGTHLYVINELNATVSVFPFDQSSGALGALAQTIEAVPAGFPAQTRSGAEIVVDPTGRFLYTSNRRFVNHPQADSIAEFRIDPTTGLLSSIGWYTAGVATPRTMGFDPSGRWLYVANQGGTSLLRLTVDPTTGVLSSAGSTATAAEPAGIVFATP